MKSSLFTHTSIASILAAASIPKGDAAHAFSEPAGNPTNSLGWQVKSRSGNTIDNPPANTDNPPADNTPPADSDNSTADLAAAQAELERLRKHNQTLLDEKKAEKQKREQEQAEKERLAEEAIRKSGDAEAINKQWQEKYEKLEAELKARDEKQAREAINATAFKLASSLTDNTNDAEILTEFLSRRLKFEDDAVKVLNLDGTISINSLDELKNEFIASGKYNSLIQGTKASGVGATGSAGNNPKAPNTMSEKERAELLKNNPERFKQLFGKK